MVDRILDKIVATAEAVAEWCSEMLRQRASQETREAKALRKEREKQEWLRNLRQCAYGCAEEDLAKEQWGPEPVVLPHIVVRHGGNGPYIFRAAFAHREDANKFCEDLRRMTGDPAYECTEGRFVRE